MKTHFPWKELGYAGGFVIVTLGLYVGIYFATMKPVRAFEVAVVDPSNPLVKRKPIDEPDEELLAWGGRRLELIDRVVPRYRLGDVLGDDRLAWFFAPIHDVDRRFRTELWKDRYLGPPPPLPTVPVHAPPPVK